LTLDDIFYLVNADYVSSVNTFLTSREWELFEQKTGFEKGFPRYEDTGWRPESSLPLNDLPVILVRHFGSFDNFVHYTQINDRDHLRRLENDVRERGYKETPPELALFFDIFVGDNAYRGDKVYRNDKYEVVFSDTAISVLHYKDIEFYRAEFARLEQEEFARANQPATLHIYRTRNRTTLGGLIGVVPRYDIFLDNVLVGNSNNNWKTTVNVTSLGTKTVFAMIDGRTADLQINFEPGGVYYLRSDISSATVNTGETRTTQNRDGTTRKTAVTEIQHTPVLQLVDRSIGEREFNAIK